MEIRKVFRAGNSHVISLPPEVLAELGLKEGSQLVVEFNKGQKSVTLRPLIEAKAEVISTEYAALVEEFINEYEDVLKKLAK
ncbi:MAG: AbrB/MazE/SpoVT family DNA-binding domain-containing protein [Firmicutes bacterium]|nr:AbrB/MazE/SpoVT family DNA-binding domain-containing protein [Bacillota bacterium]